MSFLVGHMMANLEITCPRCKKAQSQSTVFCGNCGSRLNPSNGVSQSPNKPRSQCSHDDNPDDACFCRRCGAALVDKSRTPTSFQSSKQTSKSGTQKTKRGTRSPTMPQEIGEISPDLWGSLIDHLYRFERLVDTISALEERRSILLGTRTESNPRVREIDRQMESQEREKEKVIHKARPAFSQAIAELDLKLKELTTNRSITDQRRNRKPKASCEAPTLGITDRLKRLKRLYASCWYRTASASNAARNQMLMFANALKSEKPIHFEEFTDRYPRSPLCKDADEAFWRIMEQKKKRKKGMRERAG